MTEADVRKQFGMSEADIRNLNYINKADVRKLIGMIDSDVGNLIGMRGADVRKLICMIDSYVRKLIGMNKADVRKLICLCEANGRNWLAWSWSLSRRSTKKYNANSQKTFISVHQKPGSASGFCGQLQEKLF